MAIWNLFGRVIAKECLTRIIPLLNKRLSSFVSYLIGAPGISDSIKQEIDKIIAEVKKSVEVEIDNKITKLKKQIIKLIMVLWLIQTGVIIALLWLFSR